MKRDMDLIRKLLLEREADEKSDEIEKTYDESVICGHVDLLLDAELIEGKVVYDVDGTARRACIKRLTWKGHEFLAASRDPTIWEKAKKHVFGPGLSWTWSLLQEYLKEEARKHIPELLPKG